MRDEVVKEILESIKIVINDGLKEKTHCLRKTNQAIKMMEVFHIKGLDDRTHDPVYYEILSYLVNKESRHLSICLNVER